MISRFNIQSVIHDRSDQASFHVAAERHVRIEFRNMNVNDVIGPLTYEGDVVVTCYRGAFRIEADATKTELGEHDQAIVPGGTRMALVCESTGTLQLIWSPAQAATTQG